MRTRARIARFSRRQPDGVVHFVLVPGGEVTLGFDGRGFAPSPQQLESFTDSAEAYGIEQSIREYVQAHTSARRAVSVPPLLVEVEAREVGIEPVGASDPVHAELRAELKGSARVEYSDGYLGWLPLATAFRDSYQGTWFTPDNVADGFSRVRRAIPIP